MKTPPFLVGGALLLWGWQSGLWWLAAPLALALETSRFVKVRWELSPADFNRLWDLCAAALIAYALYLLIADDGGLGIGAWVARGEQPQATGSRGVEVLRRLFRALPLCVSPMMLAQAWGRAETINTGTFTWILRKRFAATNLAWNVSWPFFAVTLIGASSGDHPPGFLVALTALVGRAVWSCRGREFHPAAWAGAYAVAAGLAWLGHAGLQPVSVWIRDLESEFLNRMFDRDPNSNESRTSIGSVGVRKNSGRVMFRMQSEGRTGFPGLLRETVFDTYRGAVWMNAGGATFTEMIPAGGDNTFLFSRAREAETSVRLWLPADQKSLVPHPSGLRRLEEVPADSLETNGLGVIRANGLRFGGIVAVFGGRASPDSPPGVADGAIPEAEAAVLNEVAKQIGLSDGTSVREQMGRIARFFGENFSYSLYRGRPAPTRHTNSTLASFLLNDRRGHCEYFATATTLLLRRAGIPARYVVGWAVPAPESDGEWTLIRARHAHAWTVAFIDGAWREIDNTPSSWTEAENARRTRWETFRDAWSKTVFEWNRLRNGQAAWRNWLLLPAVLVLAGLMVQFFRRRGWRRHGAEGSGGAPVVRPGLDSEFYAVIRALEKSGFERRPGETLPVWLRRIRASNPASAAPPDLLLGLHYRLRFDPESLAPEERSRLREESGEWLRRRR